MLRSNIIAFFRNLVNYIMIGYCILHYYYVFFCSNRVSSTQVDQTNPKWRVPAAQTTESWRRWSVFMFYGVCRFWQASRMFCEVYLMFVVIFCVCRSFWGWANCVFWRASLARRIRNSNSDSSGTWELTVWSWNCCRSLMRRCVWAFA